MSRHHRAEGRAVHRALLDPNVPGTPVLAVEDMAIAHDVYRRRLDRVIIALLSVWEADGGPWLKNLLISSFLKRY
jgi:hypothetical protein